MEDVRDMADEIRQQTPQTGEIILYQPDETVRLKVRLEDDTVWLTQQQMAELFQKDQSVIARHIGNVFREGELEEMSNMQILHNTLSKFLIIDDDLWHCGASFKDLGRRLFAIDRLNIDKNVILNQL